VTGAPVALRIVTSLCGVLALFGLGTLLVLAFFTLLDGLLRFAINRPIDLVREVSDLVAAIAVAACLPISLLQRSNITLRALNRLPSQLLVRLINVAADLLVLVVVAAIAWQFFLFAQKTGQAGDVTWLMNLPKAPFWFVVSGILAIAAVVQLQVLAETCAGRAPTSRIEGVA
jgi:TRAP-type C4-dicarboxylate transport system permease small subunit